MPNRNIEGNYRYGYQGEYAEKEEIGSTNSFELRLWDSRIGRWMSPDPYNEFSSPYLGMGNNPLKFIDIDGGKIYIYATISGKSTTFEYKNGTLYYAQSGKEYKGTDSFLTEVKTALRKLDYGYKFKNLVIDSGGNIGTNSFINSLVTAKDIYRIRLHPKQGNSTNGLEVLVDPKTKVKTYTRKGLKLSPFFITLGHELAHAWDNAKGISDKSVWYKVDTNGDGVKNRSVKKSEQFASAIENMFRGEHQLPLRKYYSVDTSGSPLNQSLLLDKTLNTIFTLKGGVKDKCKCGN